MRIGKFFSGLTLCISVAPPASRPEIEYLEPRRLLQGCTVINGVMTVTGNSTAADIITVAEDASERMTVKNGVPEIDHTNCYVPRSSLTLIYIDAVGGDDLVTIMPSVSSTLPTHLFGGSGNDTLIGGNGNDTLEGTGGDDSLDGGAGDDLMDGGSNNDTLLSGPGDDTLVGGNSYEDVADYHNETADLFLAQDGIANDGVRGERDYIDDTIEFIWGGSGNDRIILSDGGGGNKWADGRGGNGTP